MKIQEIITYIRHHRLAQRNVEMDLALLLKAVFFKWFNKKKIQRRK